MTFDEEHGDDAGFGLGDLLSQVQQMQEMLATAQAEASDQVVIGQAADGAVKIGVSGGLEFKSVEIDPSVVEQGDATLLEDLVLVALHDAMAKVSELNLSAMAHSGLDDLAGFDMGFGEIGMPGLGGAVPAGDAEDADDAAHEAGPAEPNG